MVWALTIQFIYQMFLMLLWSLLLFFLSCLAKDYVSVPHMARLGWNPQSFLCTHLYNCNNVVSFVCLRVVYCITFLLQALNCFPMVFHLVSQKVSITDVTTVWHDVDNDVKSIIIISHNQEKKEIKINLSNNNELYSWNTVKINKNSIS